MKNSIFDITRRTVSLAICVLLFSLATETNATHPSASAPRHASSGTRLLPKSIPSVLAAPDDKFWDDRFAVPGVDGQVYAVATSGTDVYAGGMFLEADGLTVNNIARWDGVRSFALGEGVSGCVAPQCSDPNHISVTALAVQGNIVYVGGNFSFAGTTQVNSIAKWDGNQWTALGSGVDGRVRAIAISGTNVFVGGEFGTAGGIPVHGIAKWSSETNRWSALDDGVVYANGVSGRVHVIRVHGAELVVGGTFDKAGNVSATNIARWDGANWSPLDTGVDSGVYDLAVSGPTLFAAAGGRCIAQWDGASWTFDGTPCSGVPLDSGYAGAIAVFRNDLFVISRTTQSYRGFLYRKHGGTWERLLERCDLCLYSIAADAESLYLGGSAYGALSYTFGGTGIVRWDGSRWNSLFNTSAKGILGLVYALASDDKSVYVGGELVAGGNVKLNGVGRWDGNEWSPLGDGLNGAVYAIALRGSEVFVGGVFSKAGGVDAANVAKWDGSQWSALASGVDGTVTALAIQGDDVYVGGTFTFVGGQRVNNIARWNTVTQNWSRLGTGVNVPSSPGLAAVNALAVSGDDLYVGGGFKRVGREPIKHIARWDGKTWAPLGEGVNGIANAIAVKAKKIYVGGTFVKANGMLTNHIAKWNSAKENWSALDEGTNGSVAAIAVSAQAIYIGGNFHRIGTATAHHLAQWNRGRWSPLGSGIVGGEAYALTVQGYNVYVGGQFDQAGGKSSSNFALWHNPTPARPQQIAPSNGASFNKKKPLLDWSDVDGTTFYQAKVRRDTKKGTLVEDTLTDESQFQTRTLDAGKTYVWRVRACFNAGETYCSEWTKWWSFSIQP